MVNTMPVVIAFRNLQRVRSQIKKTHLFVYRIRRLKLQTSENSFCRQSVIAIKGEMLGIAE